jgi:tricorn protease-like protein
MKKLKPILILMIASIAMTVKAQDSIDIVIHNYLKEHQIPGAVIVIVNNDSLVKLSSYGLSDVQNNADLGVHCIAFILPNSEKGLVIFTNSNNGTDAYMEIINQYLENDAEGIIRAEMKK